MFIRMESLSVLALNPTAGRIISEQMQAGPKPVAASTRSGASCRSRLVRARGIEPRFQAWEAHVIAVILRPHLADVPSRPASFAVKRAAGRGFARGATGFALGSIENSRDARKSGLINS